MMICSSHFRDGVSLSSLRKLCSISSLSLRMARAHGFQEADIGTTFSRNAVFLSSTKDIFRLISAQRAFSCSRPNCKLNANPRSLYPLQYLSSTTMTRAMCHWDHNRPRSWRALMSHGTHFVHSTTESPSKQVGEEWSGIVVRPNERLHKPMLTVAVDIDEVLGSFLLALNTFISEQYLANHNLSEFSVYDFTKVWQCSQVEANLRVHSFFKSKHFDKGILPIPGAHKALLRIASFCSLCIVTSRQNIIKDETLAWIERHYSGIFREVHFGNHFALEGEARTKADICRAVGAQVLIDDNPVYALDCAKNGMEVLLFDFNNGYPWSKIRGPPHPSITVVKNWDEVERILRLKSSTLQS